MFESKRSLIYLTVGDGWSGVIQSQVVDVMPLLEVDGVQPTLVTFLSIRGFLKNRRQWKNKYRNCLVLLMWPSARNWMKNRWLLKWVIRRLRPTGIVCRGPIATVLALETRGRSKSGPRICYDGRSARTAELDEYSPDNPMRHEMARIERRAVREADHRLAVSEKLVEYWREAFGYVGDNHTVIPCSLSDSFDKVDLTQRIEKRLELGWDEKTCGLVYSGSTAGWQVSSLLRDCLRQWLRKPHVHMLFLSNRGDLVKQLEEEFPGKVVCRWVTHGEVATWLCAADFGLLLRDRNVTNRVAAPVKFAEYLACGLKALCSEQLGDYSDMALACGLGHVLSAENIASINLEPVSADEKNRMQRFAHDHFSKKCPGITESYREIVGAL
jgi:hypothetical protein